MTSPHIADTTNDPAFVPLTVTVTLDEPLMGNLAAPRHLDGPLSWSAHLEALEHGIDLPPPHGDRAPTDFNLGLATWTAPAPESLPAASRTNSGHAWGWATSAAHLTVLGHTAIMERRSPPARALRDYSTDRRQHLAAGPYRARSFTRPAVWIAPLTWHILGQQDRVTELLDKLTHLGAGTHRGYGRIAHIDVQPHSDRDAWRHRTWPDPTSHTVGGIRAPYHHHTRQTTVRHSC